MGWVVGADDGERGEEEQKGIKSNQKTAFCGRDPAEHLRREDGPVPRDCGAFEKRIKTNQCRNQQNEHATNGRQAGGSHY